MKLVVIGGTGRIGSKLSVVGADSMRDGAYVRAKLAQERLIQASPIPYTIVRAAQLFALVGSIAAAARYFGALLSERTLVPAGEARLGEMRFTEWLGR